LAEAVTAKEDVWGDAAMREPNGASYEFFAKLIPPLHYVNADFKHYPIVFERAQCAEESATDFDAAASTCGPIRAVGGRWGCGDVSRGQ